MSLEKYIQPGEEKNAMAIILAFVKELGINNFLEQLASQTVDIDTQNRIVDKALSIGLLPYMTVGAGLSVQDIDLNPGYDDPEKIKKDTDFIEGLWQHIPQMTQAHIDFIEGADKRKPEEQRIDHAINFVRASVVWFDHLYNQEAA